METNIIKILGLNFFNGQVKEVVNFLKSGGLLVVPSGPGLASIKTELTYYNSLRMADIVLPDSGFMALLWNLTHWSQVKRISGLEFLIAYFKDQDVKNCEEIFLVNPRQNEARSNLFYLRNCGYKLSKKNSYIAPVYDKQKIEDETLLNLLMVKKPKYILINLGGGVQEILGAYLKENLDYKPAIICTGAAIAFLTGNQVHIPSWADRLFLGWLFRCIDQPKIYIPRYLSALKLIIVMFHFNRQPQMSLSIE